MKKENKMEGIKVGMLKKLCSLAMVAIMTTTLITGCSSGNGKDSKGWRKRKTSSLDATSRK